MPAPDSPPLPEPPPPFDADSSFGPPPSEQAPGVVPSSEAEPPSELTPHGPSLDAKVELVLQRLRDTKPMVAQILARAQAIEMKGEKLVVSFPANRSLFKDRLKDRGSLEAIEEAAKEAIGQSLRVTTAIAVGEPAPPRAAEPRSEAGPLVEPGHRGETTARRETAPPREPGRPSAPPEPSGAQEAARKKLWQRAEEEPLVKSFLEELGGQLTEVEEI